MNNEEKIQYFGSGILIGLVLSMMISMAFVIFDALSDKDMVITKNENQYKIERIVDTASYNIDKIEMENGTIYISHSGDMLYLERK